MESEINSPEPPLFSFDPNEFAQQRASERSNTPEIRNTLALEHIADDLSVIRCVLQRISQHMPK